MAGSATTRLTGMNVTVQIVRRRLMQPTLGQAEPRQSFDVVMTTRAESSTRSGDTEFSSVNVNGVSATDTFTFRWTTIKIDTRDYVRDARGNLYKILSVENVNMQNRVCRLQCSAQGSENVEGAR